MWLDKIMDLNQGMHNYFVQAHSGDAPARAVWPSKMMSGEGEPGNAHIRWLQFLKKQLDTSVIISSLDLPSTSG